MLDSGCTFTTWVAIFLAVHQLLCQSCRPSKTFIVWGYRDERFATSSLGENSSMSCACVDDVQIVLRCLSSNVMEINWIVPSKIIQSDFEYATNLGMFNILHTHWDDLTPQMVPAQRLVATQQTRDSLLRSNNVQRNIVVHQQQTPGRSWSEARGEVVWSTQNGGIGG